MKKKNNPLLPAKPSITAVIVRRIEKRTVKKALDAGADMLELRVDTFDERTPESLLRAVKRLREYDGCGKVPLLLTCRARAEGGVHAMTLKEKRLVFQALMPFVSYIDIELVSAAGFKGIILQAKKAGVGMIISYHNFKSTPGAARLLGIIKKGRAAGGDIIKIAATANSRNEILRLTALLIGNSDLIIIAMGPQGKATRVFFPLLGSLITYASVTKGSAPGQMPVAELVRAFKTYGIVN